MLRKKGLKKSASRQLIFGFLFIGYKQNVQDSNSSAPSKNILNNTIYVSKKLKKRTNKSVFWEFSKICLRVGILSNYMFLANNYLSSDIIAGTMLVCYCLLIWEVRPYQNFLYNAYDFSVNLALFTAVYCVHFLNSYELQNRPTWQFQLFLKILQGVTFMVNFTIFSTIFLDFLYIIYDQKIKP